MKKGFIMLDVGTISMAVSSVKTAIDIAKSLKESSDSFESAEVKLQLAELISSLADAKMEIAEIQEQLIISERERKDLQKKLEKKEKLIFEQPYYWVNLEGGKRDGPFCQVCYDKEQKLIRLQDENDGLWRCLSCKEFFRDKNYKEYDGDLSTAYRTPFD